MTAIITTSVFPQVVERAREALKFIDRERLWLAPDCGCVMLPLDVAKAKLKALADAVDVI